MSTNTFEGAFKARIENIIDRAAKAGTSLTALCEATEISRATPDRWLAAAPRTIKLVDKLEAALVEAERAAAK